MCTWNFVIKKEGYVGKFAKTIFCLYVEMYVIYCDQDIIFQMTELQCKWVARVLSGKVLLPTEKEMLADVEEYYQQMEKDGFPKHMTHYVHFKEVLLSLHLFQQHLWDEFCGSFSIHMRVFVLAVLKRNPYSLI